MSESSTCTWEDVALAYRRSVATSAVGEQVELGWTEHDPECPVWQDQGCSCPAVYWFRGLRHVVAVDPALTVEVLPLS